MKITNRNEDSIEVEKDKLIDKLGDVVDTFCSLRIQSAEDDCIVFQFDNTVQIKNLITQLQSLLQEEQ